MLFSNFEVSRTIAWLIDGFLFILTIIILVFIDETIDVYSLGEILGFQTIITESGVVRNNFWEFWKHYGGMYIFYYLPAILYLGLSKYFSQKRGRSFSIGKWLMNLDVEQDTSALKFILSTAVFLCLYYFIPYIFFNASDKIKGFVIFLFLFDIAFIFLKGQLLHNYIFGIKIICKSKK